MHQISVVYPSRNGKTGPILVTTSAEESCADSCPLKSRLLADGSKIGGGCYAEHGPLKLNWDRVSTKRAGMAWAAAMDKISSLPKGALWRHNQAGDLPGLGDEIDAAGLSDLIKANRGKRGFTYTHKPADRPDNAAEISRANAEGFTINLSADNLAEADSLADLGIAPVVVVLPADASRAIRTPAGRLVAICPATISDNVNCSTCGICQLKDRKAIIGFPAHGTAQRKATAVAIGS